MNLPHDQLHARYWEVFGCIVSFIKWCGAVNLQEASAWVVHDPVFALPLCRQPSNPADGMTPDA